MEEKIRKKVSFDSFVPDNNFNNRIIKINPLNLIRKYFFRRKREKFPFDFLN